MAHFYGYVCGNRGSASRTGVKSSGLVARADGRNIGGAVRVLHDRVSGEDMVELFVSGGSSSSGEHHVLSVSEGGKVVFHDARMALAYAAVAGVSESDGGVL